MQFQKGNSGRKVGSQNVMPKRSLLIAIFEKLEREQPELFENAIQEGLKSKAPINAAYLKMWAEYREGKPIERHEVSGPEGGPIPYKWQDDRDSVST